VVVEANLAVRSRIVLKDLKAEMRLPMAVSAGDTRRARRD
jgi:hypothetical protein